MREVPLSDTAAGNAEEHNFLRVGGGDRIHPGKARKCG